VLRLADIAAEELAWTGPLVDDLLEKAVDESGRLDLLALSASPRGLIQRVNDEYLRRIMALGRSRTHRAAAVDGPDPGRRHRSASVLAGNLIAKKGYHTVSVGKTEAGAPAKPIPARPVLKRGITRVPELGISLRQQIGLAAPGPGDEQRGRAVFDYYAVANGMWVRTWREGDRFKPLGAPGSKKLQDFFVNQKVPQELRHRIPLVVAPGGEVLWVVGYRISDEVR